MRVNELLSEKESLQGKLNCAEAIKAELLTKLGSLEEVRETDEYVYLVLADHLNTLHCICRILPES
jgi:hypothetical protein